jgi:hypothetical protein
MIQCPCCSQTFAAPTLESRYVRLSVCMARHVMCLTVIGSS